jgi:hypothetical protein
LTRHAAAFGEGFDIESLLASQSERGAEMLLMGDAGEVFFDRFAIDRDGAVAGSQPNARDGVFALAGAVKCVCHDFNLTGLAAEVLQDERLRVLRGVRMLVARENAEFKELLMSERVFRQHSFDRFFQNALRMRIDHRLRGRPFHRAGRVVVR